MIEQEHLDNQLRRTTHLTVYSPVTRKSPFWSLFLDVLLPMALFGPCAAVLVFGVFVAIFAETWPLAFAGIAVAIGSAVTIVIGYIQLGRYHEKSMVIKEYEMEPAEAAPESDGPRQVVVNGNGNSRNVLFPRRPKMLDVGNSKFEMSGKNLDELKKRVQDGDWSIRRDTAGDLKGFNSLPDSITGSRYTECIYCLRESGFAAGSNPAEWTEAGRAWLQED